MSNLWFSYSNVQLQLLYEKSSNILLEAGRDITVSMQHKLHRKKINPKLYYTSLKLWIITKTIHWYCWLQICQHWSLWRRLKSLKHFSSWQNSKTLQCSSYTHLLLCFRLMFYPGAGHRIPNAEGLCTSNPSKSTTNLLQRLYFPGD